jgi:hypothetical protein
MGSKPTTPALTPPGGTKAPTSTPPATGGSKPMPPNGLAPGQAGQAPKGPMPPTGTRPMLPGQPPPHPQPPQHQLPPGQRPSDKDKDKDKPPQ